MAKTFLSHSARTLRSSVFAELTPRIRELGDRCIPLHIGDTYRLPPEASLQSLRDVSLSGLTTTEHFKYTHPYGNPGLIEVLVAKLRRDNAIITDTDSIQVTCGATQGLSAVAQTFLDPGDELLVLCPYWPLIKGIVETVGGVVVEAPFKEAIEDPETLLGPLITARTKAIYLANPNNPDGQLLNMVEAERLYDFATQSELALWSDEAYEHIVFDGQEKVSLGSLDNEADKPRVVSVFTFSKSFAMAGLRVGYVVGPKEIMTCLRRVSTHQIYDLGAINQEAALAAIGQPQADYHNYLDEQNRVYQQARDLLHSAFPQAPLPPGGAYLFVPFGSQERAWKTMLALLEKGVSSAPGEAFGSFHPHCLRLCFTATPADRLEKAVRLIGELEPIE